MSPQEWEAARLHLLVKEKELTRARDALAAERRRMPWLGVEKEYEFDGPEGKASLLDLFDAQPSWEWKQQIAHALMRSNRDKDDLDPGDPRPLRTHSGS